MFHQLVRVAAFMAAYVFALAGSAVSQETKTPVNPDAKNIAAFQEHVDTYVELHKKVEAGLPKLPQEATPQQIDRNQRELGRLIQAGRPMVKQGDIFTPEMQTLVRRLMVKVFSGADGPELKASVMDENPVGTVVKVNDRYPDNIPLSTMPPQILESLPKMPEELTYRFVGGHLIILDDHAHLIVDFVPNALPK